MASVTLAAGTPSMSWEAVAVQEPAPPAEDIEKGRELAERVCTACHELGPDVTAGRSADAWKKVVEEMRIMGAQASDEEAALITAYLIKTYPAQPGRSS
jgi:cytochrome c2